MNFDVVRFAVRIIQQRDDFRVASRIADDMREKNLCGKAFIRLNRRVVAQTDNVEKPFNLVFDGFRIWSDLYLEIKTFAAVISVSGVQI